MIWSGEPGEFFHLLENNANPFLSNFNLDNIMLNNSFDSSKEYDSNLNYKKKNSEKSFFSDENYWNNSISERFKCQDPKRDEDFQIKEPGIIKDENNEIMAQIEENNENIGNIISNQEISNMNKDINYKGMEENKIGEEKTKKEDEDLFRKNEERKKIKEMNIEYEKVTNKIRKSNFNNLIRRTRTAINHHHLKKINDAIKNSDLHERLKKINIKIPDYDEFSKKMNRKKVRKELDLPFKDILCKYYSKDKKFKINKNELYIKDTMDNYKKNPSEKNKQLYLLLSMKYREVIENFWNSDDFKKFEEKEKETIDYIDFNDKKGYSFLGNNGFFIYFEGIKKASEEKETFINKKRNRINKVDSLSKNQ